MSKAGKFKVMIWKDEYPVKCTIEHSDNPDHSIDIDGSELYDLRYAIDQAVLEAKLIIPMMYGRQI